MKQNQNSFGIGSEERRSLCVTTKISIGRQGNTERSPCPGGPIA
ncbi:hypothetical protein [Nostoc sp.]